MSEEVQKPLLGRPWEWGRDFALATLIGAFLGLLGPFGSYLNGSRLFVFVYWIASLWLGVVLCGLVMRPVAQFAARSRFPRYPMLMLGMFVIAIVLGLACHLLATALWPDTIGRIGLLVWFGQTLLITVPLTVGYLLLNGLQGAMAPAGETGTAADRLGAETRATPFLSRLPQHVGRDIVALQMEDHYVRAHTRIGSALILIPLRQAIRELDDRAGIQVHRSWWVARDAVVGCVQDGVAT